MLHVPVAGAVLECLFNLCLSVVVQVQADKAARVAKEKELEELATKVRPHVYTKGIYLPPRMFPVTQLGKILKMVKHLVWKIQICIFNIFCAQA